MYSVIRFIKLQNNMTFHDSVILLDKDHAKQLFDLTYNQARLGDGPYNIKYCKYFNCVLVNHTSYNNYVISKDISQCAKYKNMNNINKYLQNLGIYDFEIKQFIK